ncbi:MFS transporter [Roseomonas frigidaquae]|uniref:MFS transporter n=2 Tax=Falsiroseomonas frigidaquae TaxID=487318 RepID=A0ABX1F4F2_9PROT|nr:MFS transporter [Falsiroseomonas frigidaquae]
MEPFLMQAEEARMKRDVRILFFCQALMNASVVGQVAMGGLVGYSLATDKSLATLPLALQMVATMAASIPAGIIFARLGRRAGFLMGAAGSFCGALTFALGIWLGDFWVYALGALPAGIGFGIAQHYRFAAAEVASPAYRPKAISLVMAGGVLAAIFGPELVKHSRDLFEPFLFLGTYLILSLLPIGCAVLLTMVRLPPAPPRPKVTTPVIDILRRPAFLAAAGTGAMAYGTMNLLMTSTPLEMMACGFGVGASATVIQAHAVAMFAPGFFTGRLIARFGARTIIGAGVALNALCVAVAVQDETFWHFTVALVLLGLGWNFMFTGATTLLGEAHSPDERVRAQTANDFIVFGTVACTALGSGVIHATAGWEVLNLMLLPALLFALGLTLFLRPARIRAT